MRHEGVRWSVVKGMALLQAGRRTFKFKLNLSLLKEWDARKLTKTLEDSFHLKRSVIYMVTGQGNAQSQKRFFMICTFRYNKFLQHSINDYKVKEWIWSDI